MIVTVAIDWIPKRNMISDGPVMRKWAELRKCKFHQGMDYIRLAVDPGSSLAMDCDLRTATNHLAETHYRYPGRPAAGTTAASKKQLDIAPSPAAKAASRPRNVAKPADGTATEPVCVGSAAVFDKHGVCAVYRVNTMTPTPQ